MRVVHILLLIFMGVIFTSCGGSGGGSAGDTVSVKIRIDRSAFENEARSISYSGKVIDRIKLKISAADFTAQEIFIEDEVENGEAVEITLEAYKIYTFEIFAYDTDGDVLCYGSDEAYISRNETADVTLICSGDGEPVFVAGVAASGLPVEGTVYLKDSNGTVRTAQIDSDGSFSIDVSDLTPPYLLRAEGRVGDKYITLYSASAGSGDTANINPYSNLALSIAVGGLDLADVFSDPSGSENLLTEENITSAVGVVNNIFAGMFASMGITDFDPINGAYSADGSGMDGVLDNLSINVSGGNINIINLNTGESVVSVSVTNASEASIPDDVAQQIASYVNTGSAVMGEVKAFLSGYYLDNSGDIESYYSTSMTYLDGLPRESVIQNAQENSFDEAVSVDDVVILQRFSADSLLAYYVVEREDGSRKQGYAWLAKENGSWFFTGNGLMYSREIAPSAVYSPASGEISSGVDMLFSDTSGSYIQLFVVTGPGLPDGGLKYYNENYSFRLPESQAGDSDTMYSMTAAQINDANTAFLENGFIRYTISAYLSYTGEYEPSGTAFQTDTYFMRKPLDTVSGLSSGIFVTQSGTASYNLNDYISDMTISISTTADSLDDFSYGEAELVCETDYGFPESFQAFFTVSAPDISVDTYTQTGFSACELSIIYYNSFFRKYTTSYSLTAGQTEEEAAMEVLDQAYENLNFDDIAGTNSDASAVVTDLDLTVDLGTGITVNWSTSDYTVISFSGEVTRPEFGDVAVSVIANISYNGYTVTRYISVTVKAETSSAQRDADELDEETILGINPSARVMFDLNLPDSGVNGSNIVCVPSDTDYIDADGALLKRPTAAIGETDIVISCAVDPDGENIEKDFTVTIPAIIQDVMSSESAHSVVVRPDGTLWGWGSNSDMQLGLPADLYHFYEPYRLSAETGWNAAAAGNVFTIAIKDGVLYGAGKDSEGVFADAGNSFDTFFDLGVDVMAPSGTDDDWVFVAAGGNTAYAIKADGTLWASGSNDYGQLGTGTQTDASGFVQVGTDDDWVMISTNGTHAAALKTDGSIHTWGREEDHELCRDEGGSGGAVLTSPADVGNGQKFVYVSSADYYNMAISSEGYIYSCGSNLYSAQNPAVTALNTLVKVGTADNWVKVAAGGSHSLAVNEEGDLYGTGSNTNSALGQALSSPDTGELTHLDDSGTWETVAASEANSMGLRNGRSLLTWGYGGYNGDGKYENSDIPYLVTFFDGINQKDAAAQVALGPEHMLFADIQSYEVYGWGDGSGGEFNLLPGDMGMFDYYSTPTLINTPSEIKYVAAGEGFSAFLDKNGNLYYAGYYDDGDDMIELGLMVQSSVQEIKSGYTHLVYRTQDNTLAGFGLDTDGQLDAGGDAFMTHTDIMGAEAMIDFFTGARSTFAVKSADNRLYATGQNDFQQLGFDSGGADVSDFTMVNEDTDWRVIAPGVYHTAALKYDGTLWSWGTNTYGQLGSGGTGNSDTPVQVSGEEWISVASGHSFSVGIKEDGTLWSWGSNSSGELGNGTLGGFERAPVRIGSASDWIYVTSSGVNTVAVNSSGKVYGWGGNNDYVLAGGDSPVLSPTLIATPADVESLNTAGVLAP